MLFTQTLKHIIVWWFLSKLIRHSKLNKLTVENVSIIIFNSSYIYLLLVQKTAIKADYKNELIFMRNLIIIYKFKPE